MNISLQCFPVNLDASVSFLGNCSFDDESMCGMSICSKTSAGWERVSQAEGGPHSDHTYLGTDSEGKKMIFWKILFLNE